MSPRVAYWTSAFHPEMEAIAGEVALLRRRFRSSIAWGISPGSLFQLSWRRGFGFHPRFQLAFRGATYVLQRAFAINHLFGGLGDWFHLTAVRRKPTILTIATASDCCDARLLQKVDQFVVEWPTARQQLRELGISDDRIQTILPPVDLQRFRPAEPPGGPFTVLFASSPDQADWLEGRGVKLLLDTAALRPQMTFRLLWRPWGNSLPAVEEMIADRGLRNIDLHVGRIGDMSKQYGSAHICVAPFVRAEQCKPAPNSIIESLACGRPVVVTAAVGLSEMIREGQAGLLSNSDPERLAEALDRLASEWTPFSRRARALAERQFSAETFLDQYSRLYSTVA